MNNPLVRKHLSLACACIVLSATLSPVAVFAAEKAKNPQVIAPTLTTPSATRAVQAPSTCGQMEFDRNAGRMVRRPNVDLVVTAIEIITTSSGTWVRPTVRNRCTGAVSGDVHISIGSVVVTQHGIPPQTNVRLGYAVGVPAASSYTVNVDYDNRIPEANDRNNRCTRSTTGSCR